ncbi:MAG: aldehyde dehydrogenase family protein, partial [Pseudomonadales bacterium]|nr:aldehyde dehydrogenase family protein [Pseudomonadales bacterium]
MISVATQEFLDRKHGLWIDGKETNDYGGGELDVIDPATEKPISRVGLGDAGDIDRAVAAARRALHGPWSKMTADQRTQVLLRFAALFEKHRQMITELAVLDNGMPIIMGESCAPFAAQLLRYYAGWTSKIMGNTMPSAGAGKRPDQLFAYTAREPIGVVG